MVNYDDRCEGECAVINTAHYLVPSYNTETGAKYECKWIGPAADVSCTITMQLSTFGGYVYVPWDYDDCYWIELELYDTGTFWAVRAYLTVARRTGWTGLPTGVGTKYAYWDDCECARNYWHYADYTNCWRDPTAFSQLGAPYSATFSPYVGVTEFPSTAPINCREDLDGLVLEYTGSESAAFQPADYTPPGYCDPWINGGSPSTITIQVP